MASIGDTLVGIWEGALQLVPESLGAALSAWETARQAIRTVASGVAQAATQSVINQVLAKYQDVPLTPAVLADMAIRNLTIPTDGGTIDPGLMLEASYSGYNPGRFAALVLETGEPYGIDQALSLWWNSQFLIAPEANTDTSPTAPLYASGASLASTYGITEDELTKVVHYSRVRDEFIPDLKLLPWSTMTKADAIETVIKGKASQDLALALFVAAGGMPEQFQLLVDSAGDSIGVEKAVSLNAHGMITDQELAQVIYQSRINPEFYDVAKLTNAKWLAPYQIEKLLTNGVVDPTTVVTWLTEEGYPADQANAFVVAATAGTVHSVKAETQGIILSEYEAQVITADQATTALENLGYTADSIPFLLESYDARRALAMRNAAINRVRQAYVIYNITEAQAKADLVNLGLSTASIDQFLTYWTIEQQTNIHRLSAAQVGKLAEDGVITGDDAVTRWVQMGYAPDEADLLTYIYPPATPVTTTPASSAPPVSPPPDMSDQ